MKKLVLGVLVLVALALAGAAAFTTHRHWDWLDQHHLAGVAALESFFVAAAAVFAAVVVTQEWAEQSAPVVALHYVSAFGIMSGALAVVCLALLVLGWLWLGLTHTLRSVFRAHPILGLVVVVVAWGVLAAVARLSPAARAALLGWVPFLSKRRSGKP